MGAQGKNVILDKGYGVYTVSKDGYEITKLINSQEDSRRRVSVFLQEAARVTYEKVGDGCKTAVMLTSELIKNGIKNVEAGANPVLVKHGMEHAGSVCTSIINGMAKQVSSTEQLRLVARTSVCDEDIIDKLDSVFEALLDEIVVSVEDSLKTDISIEKSLGYTIDNGFISPYLACGNSNVELAEPYICLTDKEICSQGDILPLLEFASLNRVSVLILAANVSGEALSLLLHNYINGGIKVVAVIAGVYGVLGEEVLQDLAAFTGAKIIHQQIWEEEKNNFTYLGKAKYAKISSNKTVITGGCADKEYLDEYIRGLRYQVESGCDKVEALTLKRRIADLYKDSLTVKVGGVTKGEQQEKKRQVEKLLASCKAARISGVVSGGGQVLTQCINEIEKNKSSFDGDELVGIQIVLESLMNIRDGICIDKTCYSHLQLLDPAIVIATAIDVAISTATMYLLTEEFVSVKDKERCG